MKSTGEWIKFENNKNQKYLIELVEKITIDLENNELSLYSKNTNLGLAIIKINDEDVDYREFIKGPFIKKLKRNQFLLRTEVEDLNCKEFAYNFCTDEEHAAIALKLTSNIQKLIKQSIKIMEKRVKNV